MSWAASPEIIFPAVCAANAEAALGAAAESSKRRNMSELEKQAYELCLAIEQLPAGEYQTKLAVMASDLLQNIRAAQQLRAEDLDGFHRINDV